jgi:uncharacterized membrane protein
MATLSVLKFDDPVGAHRMLIALQGMQDRKMITLEDAAVVSWPEGANKPRIPQDHFVGEMALGGAFWGFLFGLIFFVPLIRCGDWRGCGRVAIGFHGRGWYRRRLYQARGRGGDRGDLGTVRADQWSRGP